MKKTIAGFIAGWALILTAIFIALSAVAFNRGFYQDLYAGLNLPEENQVSQQDIDRSIYAMVDYVAGKRDEMDETIIWKDNEQPAFNEKEILHMKDVRKLYRNFLTVMVILIILALAAGFWAFRKYRKAFWENFCLGIIQAMICFGMILFVAGIMAVVDFTSFWTTFHKIFFTNDLWLLNPATDFMIVICPEEMFSTMITRIVLVFGCVTVPVLAACIYVVRKRKTLYLQS